MLKLGSGPVVCIQTAFPNKHVKVKRKIFHIDSILDGILLWTEILLVLNRNRKAVKAASKKMLDLIRISLTKCCKLCFDPSS